jgi:S1-C subfamily serine protease
LGGWFSFAIITAASIPVPSNAQNLDDALRVYAVNVIRTSPQSNGPLMSSGIYLGRGAIITAAHVVGQTPRVLIAGQELPAEVIKQGSFETTDLALLSVDRTHLPVSLLLRRNPLCKESPKAGDIVIVVVPGGTARSRIISRNGSNNFIDVSTAGDSGSGVFNNKGCLLGILNAKISDFYYRMENGNMVRDLGRGSIEVAKHFVSASDIVNFIPPEFRF